MRIATIVVLTISLPLLAIGQEPTVQELEREIDAIRTDLEGRIRDLEERLGKTPSGQHDDHQHATDEHPWARALNTFNPAITVAANFVGRIDDKRVENEDGDAIDDRFNLREVELDLRASIDPWADGVMIFAVESEVPGESETEIEEGYAVLKKFPGLEEAPLGLNLKVGKFRPRFGWENLLHTHDLPQTARPRSVQTFLGEEGYSENGVSAQFRIPMKRARSTLTANFDVMNGGEIPVGEDNSGEDLAFLAHTSWLCELADGHELDVGVSAWHGRFDEGGSLDSHLYGADVMYRWKPNDVVPAPAFLIGGEVFYSEIEQEGRTHATPFGGYVWSQVGLTRNLYVNARFDYTEDLFDNSLETRTASGSISYYTTEFLRLRVGYERASSDVDEIDGLDTVYFEVNFLFGSHGTAHHME